MTVYSVNFPIDNLALSENIKVIYFGWKIYKLF